MFAEASDVNVLLEMIRATTLTDYITLEGNTQQLQLMNPAGFFKTYLIPNELPSQVGLGQTVTLEKGYYKGVIFDFPGAEVLVNGEWRPYDDTNKALITDQNPFTLQWRLNGNRLRKLGYKPGDTLAGKVIAVDDQWNDLNLSINMTLAL